MPFQENKKQQRATAIPQISSICIPPQSNFSGKQVFTKVTYPAMHFISQFHNSLYYFTEPKATMSVARALSSCLGNTSRVMALPLLSAQQADTGHERCTTLVPQTPERCESCSVRPNRNAKQQDCFEQTACIAGSLETRGLSPGKKAQTRHGS